MTYHEKDDRPCGALYCGRHAVYAVYDEPLYRIDSDYIVVSDRI